MIKKKKNAMETGLGRNHDVHKACDVQVTHLIRQKLIPHLLGLTVAK